MGAWLLREQQKLGRPLVMGIGGSQGSGKTTLARGLRLALHHCFAVSSCLLSLDDFYKASEERDRLAEQVHPLLATRGFREPMIWACSWKPWKPCRRPIRTVSRPSRYSTKGRDTRASREQFQQLQGRPGIIFVEGWCLGAQPESEIALAEPVNALEASEDMDGRWRHYVNEQQAPTRSCSTALTDCFS